MTKKELIKIIREVVKREVKNVLNEQSVEQPVLRQNEKKLSKNPLINEALNATEDFATMGTYDQSDAIGGIRSKFAEMQNPGGPVDMVPPELKSKVPEGSGLDKALNRDYSELVKKFNK